MYLLRLAIFFGLVSCALPGKQQTRLDTIIQSKVLRVGSTFDYSPFTYRDSKHNPLGTDIEMAKSLAKSLNAKLILVPTTWSKLISDLEGNKFDIAMGGISKKSSRQQVGLFSDSYLNNGKLPISRCSDKNKYKTLKKIDTPKVKLVVNPGGTNLQYAQANIKWAEIVIHPDNNTIFTEIIEKRADIMITDSAEVYHQVSKHPGILCATMDKTLTNGALAYLLPRDLIWKEYVNNWLEIDLLNQ